MTEASHCHSTYLVTLARRIAAELVGQARPRAILLTGSAAEGSSDEYSDIDLIAYYETLPTSDQLEAVRGSLLATDVQAPSGMDGQTESCLEQYVLDGVTCQVAHLTIATWERDMAAVLDAFEPATLVEKALSGLLSGAPLHGDDQIESWQARAAIYPEELARTTIEHYLTFFPLWMAAEWWHRRDATVFYHQMLVETSLNLLGVLAGLNRVYFSSFQFKRLHQFAGELHVAPEHLAERLDRLFALDAAEAGVELERLVGETVALVATHLPGVDSAAARRHLGVRQRPWRPVVASNVTSG